MMAIASAPRNSSERPTTVEGPMIASVSIVALCVSRTFSINGVRRSFMSLTLAAVIRTRTPKARSAAAIPGPRRAVPLPVSCMKPPCCADIPPIPVPGRPCVSIMASSRALSRSVLDLHAAHDHDSLDDQAGPRPLAWRRRLVLVGAHDRCALDHHRPVGRHQDLDAAPHRERVDDRRSGLDRGLPQIELAAAQDGGRIAAAEISRVALVL